MVRYIITITQRDWQEKHYYIGNAPFKAVRAIAKSLVQQGIRSTIRSIECETELDFWFLVGRRRFSIQPPARYSHAYNLGIKTAQMKGM